MERKLPRQVDTVIVGSGPSALILSYILHGHVPEYDLASPHPDGFLHEKLKSTQDLLSLDVDYLTEHFGASRYSYSTQALPVNTLIDTLIRPHGETDDVEVKSCLRWRHVPSRAVPHLVVGNTVQTGGQWVNNPIKSSWDVGALSYANMLSLPGYSFANFYCDKYHEQLPVYLRPSKRDVTEYFAIYPSKVGIADSIFSSTELSGISALGSGFYVASHDIVCNHLVLASGTYTSFVQPQPSLQPLLALSGMTSTRSNHPLLVVGSGFTAADVIISSPATQKIIHIYKWAPSKSPSPLKACHQNAYPEYAGVYRKMKLAALASSKSSKGKRPMARRASSSIFDKSRDWVETYEGLPNTEIIDVELQSDCANVTFRTDSGDLITRTIGELAYVVGRKGTLSYLDSSLQEEICPTYDPKIGVSGSDMREAANEDLEIANNIFIIGSLTGDTLIRFSYGGCVYAAGKIIERWESRSETHQKSTTSSGVAHYGSPKNSKRSRPGSQRTSGNGSPVNGFVKSMHGFDGHEIRLDDINGNSTDGRQRQLIEGQS